MSNIDSKDHSTADQQSSRSPASSQAAQVIKRYEPKSCATDLDILTRNSGHFGTVRYRLLILENVTNFDSSRDTHHKKSIVKKIINELVPGRFLRPRPSKEDGKPSDMNEIMGEQTVYKKIYSAMRDCPSDRCDIVRLLKKARAEKERLEMKLENSRTRKKNKSVEAIHPDGNISNIGRKINHAVLKEKINRHVEGTYCRKNLEPVETIDKDYFYTNNEYEQQITNLSSKTRSDVHVTSQQITHFIEKMVQKGAVRRQNNPSIDEGWFSSERQSLVRMQLLKRCYAATESTLSLPTFFHKFSEGLFGEPYNSWEGF